MGLDVLEEVASQELRRRVFVLASESTRSWLTSMLRADGFEVHDSSDAANAVGQIHWWKPDVVLFDEQLASKGGHQVMLSLRANGEAFHFPVAALLTDTSLRNSLKWLRLGATDVWECPLNREVTFRTRELIDECAQTRVHLRPLGERLIAWVDRAHLSGAVTLYPGTPFEGRATFARGKLKEAQFGSLTGEAALEQLLELDEVEDGPAQWEEHIQRPRGTPHQTDFRARVLVVEDDDSVRVLLKRQLESAGYLVETSVDGQAGLQLATQKPWDILVADLDLPRLDGWGLLRALRADVLLREISVIVLSAHGDTVGTLKAAQAGARAYLKKSGRSRELLDAVALMALPRARTWSALIGKQDVRVELRSVGAMWLIHTLAELDCGGSLQLQDAMGRYELTLAEGRLVDAQAQIGSLRLEGLAAVQALIASRGEGRFLHRLDRPTPRAPWIYDLLDEAREAMRVQDAQRLREAMLRPGNLAFEPELANLFAHMASADELKVLVTVKGAPKTLDLVALSQRTGLPMEELEQALGELLRRGVLMTTEPGTEDSG